MVFKNYLLAIYLLVVRLNDVIEGLVQLEVKGSRPLRRDNIMRRFAICLPGGKNTEQCFLIPSDGRETETRNGLLQKAEIFGRNGEKISQRECYRARVLSSLQFHPGDFDYCCTLVLKICGMY